MADDTVRTHVVLPAQLVRDIDALVGRRKRSLFLARVAAREVKRLQLLAIAEAAAGSLPADAVPEWSTPEKTYAWVREQRRLGEAEREERLWGRGSPLRVSDGDAHDEPTDPPG